MAKNDHDNGTISLSREQLAEMLEQVARSSTAAAVAAVRGVQDAQPQPARHDDWREHAPSLARVVHKGCVSPVTGATFDAVEDRNHRTVTFENYTRPVESTRHVDDGGAVPNGHPMVDAEGVPNPGYRQWLYENYFLADANAFIGKPFHKGLQRTPFDQAAAAE